MPRLIPGFPSKKRSAPSSCTASPAAWFTRDLAARYLCMHNALRHMSGRHSVQVHVSSCTTHLIIHKQKGNMKYLIKGNAYFSQNRYKGPSSKLSKQKGIRNSSARHFAYDAKKVMSDSDVRHPCRRLADPRTGPLRADAHRCHNKSPFSDVAPSPGSLIQPDPTLADCHLEKLMPECQA